MTKPRFFRRRPKLSIDTSFRETIECAAKLCSADYIMKVGKGRRMSTDVVIAHDR